jgi:sarcosine oxidase subunit gamma
MATTTVRTSPIHEWLEPRTKSWSEIAGCHIALQLVKDAEAEESALDTVALCDCSALPKFGLKGKDAPAWLETQGITVPEDIYDTAALDDGGLIVRFAGNEFMLESGLAAETIPNLQVAAESLPHGLHRVEHQEATFVLAGDRVSAVMSQTCGINFKEAQNGKLILTRVAGVSAGIIPQQLDGRTSYRLWVDYSLAPYLWETLLEIAQELGGRAVGLDFLYPGQVSAID